MDHFDPKQGGLVVAFTLKEIFITAVITLAACSSYFFWHTLLPGHPEIMKVVEQNQKNIERNQHNIEALIIEFYEHKGKDE